MSSGLSPVLDNVAGLVCSVGSLSPVVAEAGIPLEAGDAVFGRSGLPLNRT